MGGQASAEAGLIKDGNSPSGTLPENESEARESAAPRRARTDMIQHPTERKLRPPPPRHARQSLAPSSARSCQARVVLVA